MPEEASQVTPTGDQGTPPQQTSLGWRAGLPDDLKANEAFTSFKTVGEFAKAHIETRTKLTEAEGKLKDAIPKLPEDATDEERDVYYHELGRPDKPEEYEFEKPTDGQPPLDDKLVAASKTAFHRLGLTKDQAKGLSGWWNTYMGEIVKAETELRTKQRNDAEVALKAELGSGYDAAVSTVKKVWADFVPKDAAEFLTTAKLDDGTILGNHPALIRWVLNIAKKTGEDRSPPGGPRRVPEVTPGIVYDKSPEPPRHGY